MDGHSHKIFIMLQAKYQLIALSRLHFQTISNDLRTEDVSKYTNKNIL